MAGDEIALSARTGGVFGFSKTALAGVNTSRAIAVAFCRLCAGRSDPTVSLWSGGQTDASPGGREACAVRASNFSPVEVYPKPSWPGGS